VRWSRGTSKNGTIPRQPSGFAGCRFGGGPVVGSEMCLSITRMTLTNSLVLAILVAECLHQIMNAKLWETPAAGAQDRPKNTQYSISFG
jgi:hypothetical protein